MYTLTLSWLRLRVFIKTLYQHFMGTPEHVTTEVRDHLLLIGLNRPEKLNAFNPLLIAQLAAAYTRLDEDPALRCGVLFAHGDDFTGGLDLEESAPLVMQGQMLIPAGLIDPWGIYSERKRNKPIVCAVQGRCLTLGIELILASDVTVAAKNTRFAQLEIKRGIFPFGGATFRLPERVGWGNAMRYLLTGDTFDADTAYRIGLVQELCEPGEQLSQATALAERIAEQAPLGVAETLRSARAGEAGADGTGSGGYFLSAIVRLFNSTDAREGMLSFLQKRKAKFSGN
jgi:enoyl-CoA hydratase